MVRKNTRANPWLLLFLAVVLLSCSSKGDYFTGEEPECEFMCQCYDCKCDEQEKIPVPEGSPKTLVSAGKFTISSSGSSASMLIDGKYRESSSWYVEDGDLPAWAAIEVGGGICELLLLWTAASNSNYNLPSPPAVQYGAPTSYKIETSADSTNGSDGTWTTVTYVANNTVTARSHRIPFCNQRWLRFTVLDASSSEDNITMIHEIELHDNSNGKIDGWLFFGDSITVNAFNRKASQNPAFATLVWEADPSHYPMQINGGYNSDSALVALDRLKKTLDANDGIKIVAICLGTNDMGPTSQQREKYRKAMRELISEVKSRGKIAIIPRIPWANRKSMNLESQLAMNQVVDDLRKEFNLPAGPDLFAFFYNNPHLLIDDVHPNEEGNKGINRLWAEAAKEVSKF